MASISYELTKFNPQPNAELLCAICFCVLHEPCMCPCHHIFCNSCIRKWLENNNTCPTCRGTVNLQQLELAPPLVQNVLNDLTMDCEYKNEGCEGSISKGNFPSHIGTCDFRPVSCPHKDCSKEVTARDLSAHTKECQYRSLQCLKQCQLQLQAHELEKHDCVTALQGRVQELDGILHKHQLMLKWIRTKLNNVQMPEQSPDVQLEAYDKFLMDINHYWPEDQPIPVLLCGNYIAPSAPVTNSQSTSTANTNESVVSVLEQLVAGTNGDQTRPGVFGSRDPDGAESPPAHVVRDPATRGVGYEEEIDVVGGASLRNGYYPSDETGSWDTSTDPSYPGYLSNAGDDGGASPYENNIVVHQYQSPSNSPRRGSRRHRGNTRVQDRDYLLVSHSPERSRSGFDEDQSDHTLDSAGHYSSYSNQDNYSSASQLSATFSHQPESPSYGNVHYEEDYDRHQHDSDSADPDWNFSSSQAHYGSRYAESHYYGRSRSRSLSPHDQNHERHGHPRSYRVEIQHSPQSESYSPRSQSTENSERRYLVGFNRRRRRSRSRSCSTLRGRSSSRSPDHHQERSRNHSSSSSGSFNSSSQTIVGHLTDASDWMRADEDRNGRSAGNHGGWTTNWDENSRGSNIEHWSGSEGELVDGMEDRENFTPILSSSHINEHGRRTDSENIYNVLDDVVSQGQVHFIVDDIDRAQTNHSVLSPTSEQVNRHLLSPVHSDEFQERVLNPDVSVTVIQEQERHASNSPDSGHQSHPEEHAVGHSIPLETHFQQASCAQDNITTFENINRDSRIAEERLRNDFVDGKKQETLHYLAPSCSYAQSSENGALENSESVQGGTAIDGHQRSFNPGLSQNVWESSSNATSLDYDIPAEDLNPKPDTGSVCNSPDTGVEHVAEGISGEGDFASNHGQSCETGEPHGSNSGKISSKNCDSIDSDENIPNHQTRKQTGKKHQGKGKALKAKRRNKVSSVQSDTDEDSDSTVCFKRKMKVRKLLDSPSNSDVSAKETETQINLMGENVDSKADSQNSLPSTSQLSSKTMDVKKGKDKRKKEKGSEKKKGKVFSSKLNANAGLLKIRLKTISTKKKKYKSKSPPLVKKARLDRSSNYRESGAVVPDTTGRPANTEYPDRDLTIPIPKSNTQRNSLVVSRGHGSGSIGWTAENPKRSSRSHTFSRHDLSERTDNVEEGTGLNHGPASSRGRRHSLRPVETLGKRGNERRVVAFDLTQISDSSGPRSIAACHPQRETVQTQTGGPRVMQIDGSCAPSIAACYPERETVHTNTGGRRIMQIDGSHAPSITASAERQTAQAQSGGRRRTRTDSERGRIETRRHATEADRTVQIADVPVAPTTLQLLAMVVDSDETDSTWSMGSFSIESSSSA